MNPFCVRAIILIAATLISSTSFACKGLLFSDGFEDSSGTGHAPILANIADQTFILGTEAFSIDVIATDADPGDVLSYTLSKSPTGMSINIVTGSIHWVPLPSQVGDHDVQVVVCDVVEHSDSISFQITVVEASGNRSPTLIPPGNRQIQADTAFSTTLFATDPDVGDVLTFALVTAPAGMNISPASGELTWTPSTADLGSHSVTANVTDSEGLQDAKTFDITVIQPLPTVVSNAPPKLTVPANQSIVLGNQLSVQASATDADNDPLVFELVSAPTGMTIDSTSGAISWPPAAAQVGSHDVAVKVSDPHKGVDFGSFIVQVLKVNAAPVAVDDAYTVERGDTLTVAPAGVLSNDSDPDDDALSANLVSDVSAGALSLNADGSFEYTPDNPAGTLDMKLKWVGAKTYGQPTGIPAIMDLNGDGIPEIMLFDHGAGHGVLRAVHGDTGEVYFNTDVRWNHYNSPGLAVADIDLDGSLETIAVRYEIDRNYSQIGLKLSAFDHKGRPKWVSEPLPTRYKYDGKYYQDGNMQYSSITIADIDQDGIPEILVGISQGGKRIGYDVWDNQGNKIDHVWVADTRAAASPQSHVEVIDLDLDGDMEIIVGCAAWSHDGQLLWHRSERGLTNGESNNYPLSANLDDDPYPELVRQVGVNTDSPGLIAAWNHDGTTLWVSEKIGNINNFGMLSIADVDSDGYADVIAPGSVGDGKFYVLDGRDGTIKWSKQVNLGYGGAAVMDMDGDGFNEVVYMDEGRVIQVWDGRDGTDKLSYPTGEAGRSLQRNLPIFADVDGDGHAELIMLGAYALHPDLFKVYESINDDWPPMRAVWNQSSYHVTNINDDGTVPQFERPHWLLPGLNMNLSNQRLPEDRFSSTDSFTYKANDSALSSNTATVHLNVLPPNSPPQILSTPRLAASPGFEYTYGVVATDADVGETLTYALGTGPSGMQMDANHRVYWTPGIADLGAHPVVVSVTDSLGVAAYQNYVITVIDPVSVPDVTGLNQVSAETAIADALLTTGTVKSAFSKDFSAGLVARQQPPSGSVAEAGSQVSIIISLGAGPADTDNDGDGFTPNEGDCNDNDSSIHPGATDPEGDGIDQDCDGIDGNLPLSEILVLPVDSTVLANQAIKLSATGIFEDGTSQNLSSVVTWSNGPQFSSSTPGTFTVTATRDGITGSATVHVVARTGDNTPPFAAITAPGNNTTVTEPVDIIGTASDDNFLKYELAYAAAGSADFTKFGNDNSPVVDNVLGKFDPTALVNGLYTIRLTVYDRGGNVVFTEITVLVDEDLKVGNFTLTYTDVEIPLSGIPISVNRVYDSRDKGKGDFGVGWTLDIQSIAVQTNRVPGTGWQVLKSGLVFGLVPADSHVAVIRLPGGKLEIFDLVVQPTTSPFVPFPPFANHASFKARSGTLGTLVSLDNNNLSILDSQPGEVLLLDDITSDLYDPKRFRYTWPDGTEIIINKADGVESVTEPNGNTLLFQDNGIFHSTGKKVLFERDAMGRITKVTDANGDEYDYMYDANGDLRSFTDDDGNTIKYKYNLSHGLLEIHDPLGRLLARNEYDDEGRLLSTTNSDGRTVEIQHLINLRQEVITDTDGGVTLVEYDENGNIVSVTDALGGVTFHSYDSRGNQLTTTNAEGETSTRTFDANNNILTKTDPLGHTTSYTYGLLDKVTSVTDPLGRTTIFTYDSAGNLLTETDSLGNVTSHAYDVNGNPILTQDAEGNTTEMVYDAFGNMTSRTDAFGNAETFAYDANGNGISHTDKRGNTLLRQVNQLGLPTKTIDPLGNVTSMIRDAIGNLIEVVDPLGNIAKTEVDVQGKESAYVSPVGDRYERDYDLKGNLTQLSSDTGSTAGFAYDELDRITGSIDANGNTTEIEFDKVGRVIKRIDQNGNETAFEYDAAGRQIKIIDPLGNETAFTYDDTGNLLTRTDPLGHTWAFAYDALNRRVQTTYPDGSFGGVVYDALGRVIKRTDQLAHETDYHYDANGNLVSVTNPLGGITSYTYDKQDNRISRTDANGNVTFYAYDANNRLVRETLPDGTFHSWSFDAAGNQIEQVDANGNLTTFGYDANSRKIAKTFADASEVTYTYTASNSIETIADSRGQTAYTYDLNNRLSMVTNPDGSALEYVYDMAGNPLSIAATVPGNPAKVTTYTYDRMNRLETAADSQGNTASYTYDANGNLASVANPNGVITTYAYDSLNRLVEIEHNNGVSPIERYSYTLDAVGNRIRVDHLNGSYTEYEYNDLSRLVRETQRDELSTIILDNSYTYDAVGNRLTKTDETTASVTTYTYDAANHLLAAGSTTYVYDANGNTLTKLALGDVTIYSYDFENRLVAVDNGVQELYEYDDRGNRVSKAGSGSSVNYLVDSINHTGFSQVLIEYSDTNIPQVTYTFGLDLISQNRAGQLSFYHYDGINSTRLLTNAVGEITDRYNYEGFGALISQTGSTRNEHFFTGEQLDTNSGFYYLRARYYSPENGRFISQDPFRGYDRDPDSLHRYAYVYNNPINFLDYSGKFTLMQQVAVGALTSVTFTSITIVGAVVSDSREVAKYTNGRIAYQLISSAVIGAASGLIAGGSSFILKNHWIASGPIEAVYSFGLTYGNSAMMASGASFVSCLTELVIFEPSGIGDECIGKSIITGLLFAAFGAADTTGMLGKAASGTLDEDELFIVTNMANSTLDYILANELTTETKRRSFIKKTTGEKGETLDRYYRSIESIKGG